MRNYNNTWLSCRDISKIHADSEAQRGLVDINMRVNSGDILQIMGQSGTGKSTLLRIIAGLESADSGVVSVNGAPLHGRVNPNTQLVLQDYCLLPWLRVEYNMSLGCRAGYKRLSEESRCRVDDALSLFGLTLYRFMYPDELSGGTAQRVAFARVLVANPTIMLLDEAFSALDIVTKKALKSDLNALFLSRETSLRAIVMVSHEMCEYANRFVVLSGQPASIAYDHVLQVGDLMGGLALWCFKT